MAKNDERIKKFIAAVEKKKKALGKKPRSTWNTNAVFKYPDGEYHVNLNTIGKASGLVAPLAYLLEKSRSSTEAAERLGVPVPEFTHDGYTIEQWEEDFKTRIVNIEYDAKKKEFEAAKKELNSLISEDGRTDIALDKLAKNLGL